MRLKFSLTNLILIALVAGFAIGALWPEAAIGEQGLGVVVPTVKLVGSLYLTLIVFVVAVLVHVLSALESAVSSDGFAHESRPFGSHCQTALDE